MRFKDLLPQPGSRFVSLVAAAGLTAAACSGSINGSSQDDASDVGGNGGTGGGAPVGEPPIAEACSARAGRPAWQISSETAFQVRSIVGQVFGSEVLKDAQVVSMIENLPANIKAKGFDTENKAIAAQFVDGYVALAGRLAGLASEQASVRGAIESFVGKDCARTTELAADCGLILARQFASAMQRQPVADDDFKYMVEAYKTNKDKYQAAKAYGGFVASVLLSAKSALRFDNAELNKTGTIDAHALGSRLAMTLTSALPDRELRDKINDGSILKPAVTNSEGKRLLGTDAGRATLRHFAHQWMNLALLKSPPGAPGYVATTQDSALVASAAREEIGRLFENAVLEDRKLADFFATDEVVPSHDWLAKMYGTAKGDGIARTSASDRRGLLTRVAFNLYGAYGDYLPIAHRGYAVKVTMLCGSIGALPDKIDTTLPTDAPDVMSSRQYFENLTERGSCLGCHAAMNPYGYAMSGFSVTGARLANEQVKNRKTQQMVIVDVKEDVSVKFDISETKVNDASGLSEALGSSDQARACFAHRFDQYAVGMQEDFVCADDATEKPPANDLTLQDTILSYVVSSAFSAR